MNFKINESEQKLRGGYYTPLDLARYISEWVLGASVDGPILEPSCGNGNFVEIVSSLKPQCSIIAHELVESEATQATKRICKSTDLKIFVGDFLEWAYKNYHLFANKCAGAVGNPPFIRYQYMEKTVTKRLQK